MEKTRKGTLFLLPADFGENTETGHLLPLTLKGLINRINHFIVEDLKTARRFLRRAGMERPFEEITLGLLNEHTKQEEFSALFQPLLKGEDCGLLSDAGMPCVADPGNQIVKLAQMNHVDVVVIPGPSSITMTLAGSGLNGQHFTFHGYLPIDRKLRIQELKKIESESSSKGNCHLFIETPYRNNNLIEDVLTSLSPSTLLCIGKETGSPGGWIRTKSIDEWRKSAPDLHKKPCVFAIQYRW